MSATKDEKPVCPSPLFQDETVHMLLPTEKRPSEERRVPNEPARPQRGGFATPPTAPTPSSEIVEDR